MHDPSSNAIRRFRSPKVAPQQRFPAISRALMLMLGLLLGSVAGCSDKPDTLIRQQISILERATTILREVADNNDDNQAAPPAIDDATFKKQLAIAGRQMNDLRAELADLIPRVKSLKLNSEQKAQLENAHLAQYQPALIEFSKQVQRVRGLQTKDTAWTEFIAAIDQIQRQPSLQD